MLLHIYIDGEERLRQEVEPGTLKQVLKALGHLAQATSSKSRRLAACLDSERCSNVTYLLNHKHWQ